MDAKIYIWRIEYIERMEDLRKHQDWVSEIKYEGFFKDWILRIWILRCIDLYHDDVKSGFEMPHEI